MTGKIILIEGPECVGKSTLALDLKAHLTTQGIRPVYFHCPRGTDASKSIMKIIDMHKNTLDDATVALLLAATHVENINQMNEMKAQGRTVICDRSLLSFLAYQGFHGDDFGDWMNENDIPGLDVDVVLLLTATPDEITRRMSLRTHKQDVMDQYFMDNMKHIMSGYERHDELYSSDEVRFIDTTNKKPQEALQEALRAIAEVQ